MGGVQAISEPVRTPIYQQNDFIHKMLRHNNKKILKAHQVLTRQKNKDVCALSLSMTYPIEVAARSHFKN